MKYRIFICASWLCLILIAGLLLSSIAFVAAPSVADFTAQAIGSEKLSALVQFLY